MPHELPPQTPAEPPEARVDNVIYLPTGWLPKQAGLEVVAESVAGHPSARYTLPAVVRIAEQSPK